MSGHLTYPAFYTRPTTRSRTGVPGVGYSEIRRDGRKVSYFTANVGGARRRFNIKALGRQAAWKRALRARADFERQKGVA